jgi:hypothetical protein
VPGYDRRNRRTGARSPPRSNENGRRRNALLGCRFARNSQVLPSFTTILGFVSLQRFGHDQTDQRNPRSTRPCPSSTGATGALAGSWSDALDRPHNAGFIIVAGTDCWGRDDGETLKARSRGARLIPSMRSGAEKRRASARVGYREGGIEIVRVLHAARDSDRVLEIGTYQWAAKLTARTRTRITSAPM